MCSVTPPLIATGGIADGSGRGVDKRGVMMDETKSCSQHSRDSSPLA